MRIGVISALYPPTSIGGAEVMAAQLVNGLSPQDDVHVLTLESVQSSIHQVRGVERVPLRNLYWPYDRQKVSRSSVSRLAWHVIDTANPWMVKVVERWVRAHQFDVVCTQNLQGFSTSIWPMLSRMRMPVVHVLHDFSLLCPRTILFRNGKLCGHGPKRCAECRVLTGPRFKHAQSLDAVVGVSHSILNLHQEHGLFQQARCSVIYNALDAQSMPATPVQWSHSAVLRLGFLGRLDHAKGVDVLLGAAQLLQQQGIALRLVLGGRGQEGQIAAWKEQFADLHIEWCGHMAPSVLWPEIDVLVFPSASMEALGNVVLEAAAAGRPSIVSRHGGAPELVEDGVTGASFAPGDVHDLARLIAQCHAQPGLWRQWGDAAFLRAQRFNVSERIRAFRALFEEVVHAYR
ncbi:glycosyltransferase family 4 protein [Limnohabitans sp. Jir72]|uniref:glycosyltransferase family 4 protein n=1 Tax=Limnohabitans sp. Jir72 TaxID=1977909 RepID=UPI001304CF88|nr:glycosyltransferase family 4 protein [Limnohabitans sp. Jir72]